MIPEQAAGVAAFDTHLLLAIIVPFVPLAQNCVVVTGVFPVRIELESLKGSKGAFKHVYAPGELDFTDSRVRLTGSPEVSGSLAVKGKELGVQGKLRAQAEVDCDRCLKSVAVPIDTHFSLRYLTQKEYESTAAVELEEPDLIVSIYDGEVLDVDALVGEQLLLAVPDYQLCREDCRGLCAQCGADRNSNQCGHEELEVDPRWESLRNLRS